MEKFLKKIAPQKEWYSEAGGQWLTSIVATQAGSS